LRLKRHLGDESAGSRNTGTLATSSAVGLEIGQFCAKVSSWGHVRAGQGRVIAWVWKLGRKPIREAFLWGAVDKGLVKAPASHDSISSDSSHVLNVSETHLEGSPSGVGCRKTFRSQEVVERPSNFRESETDVAVGWWAASFRERNVGSAPAVYRESVAVLALLDRGSDVGHAIVGVLEEPVHVKVAHVVRVRMARGVVDLERLDRSVDWRFIRQRQHHLSHSHTGHTRHIWHGGAEFWSFVEERGGEFVTNGGWDSTVLSYVGSESTITPVS